MKKTKIDYKAIALLKMARDLYAESDKYTEALIKHLEVPEDWACNIWDYIINDESTSIPEIKRYIKGWVKEDEKRKQKERLESKRTHL